MRRKVLGVGLFCVLLCAAILAGYWDMLNTEKLTVVRDTATNAVGEIGDIVRPDPAATPKSDAVASAPAADTAAVALASKAPRIDGDPAVQAAAPETAPTTLPATDAGKATADATTSSKDVVSGKAVAGEQLPGKAVPGFDVLRVEPDGSTVLAGTAPAGATVSLRDGQTVLGTEVADASGAFVVILEKPLGVGDHQLQLEAKTTDGRVVTSAETAIVSIPEKGRENELLAMVESPDKASRLISVPSAPVAEVPATSEATAETSAAPLGAPPAVPNAAPSEPAVASATPGATSTAAGAVSAAAGASAPASPAASSLAVDAVEIEGESVYVAGRSVGSASVRVYVDNKLLAEADRLPNDRFLMTAKANVATGEHTVRADALDKAGSVITRVEVPFFKPEGRTMSAVSPAPADAGTAPIAAPAATPPMAAAPTPAVVEASNPSGKTARLADPSAATADPASNQTVADAASPASTAPAAVASAAADSPATDVPEVAVVRQPALEGVDARVIIRRGDSLWRISRDTYGRGARYTVIYLANGDQIRDPDRIYPGQVFRMPKDETVAE